MKDSLGKYFNFIFSNPNMSVNATEMREVHHQLHQVTGWFNLTTLARTYCGSANQPVVMSPRAPKYPNQVCGNPPAQVSAASFYPLPPKHTHRHKHTQTCCRCDSASVFAGARNPYFCQNAANSRLNVLFF